MKLRHFLTRPARALQSSSHPSSTLLNVLLKSELLEGGQSKDDEGNMLKFKSPRAQVSCSKSQQ